jgi:hypothetical protein
MAEKEMELEMSIDYHDSQGNTRTVKIKKEADGRYLINDWLQDCCSPSEWDNFHVTNFKEVVEWLQKTLSKELQED